MFSGDKELRSAIIQAYNQSRKTYGYRRILAKLRAADVTVSEWRVRLIMKEENLVGAIVKKKRSYSSYAGEISQAPPNLLRDKNGKHSFRADKPNQRWVTDITEFKINDSKVYLSPIIDCFDGMLLSWSISESPNADLANTSLLNACKHLKEGTHPIIHSDRGSHYRWPEWIDICSEYGLVRSMSQKGCSPDNARAEGFFGRLKVEFLYGHDWEGVSVEEFIALLEEYLVWYRDERLKSDLGYKSPMQYRKELGLVA